MLCLVDRRNAMNDDGYDAVILNWGDCESEMRAGQYEFENGVGKIGISSTGVIFQASIITERYLGFATCGSCMLCNISNDIVHIVDHNTLKEMDNDQLRALQNVFI